MRQSSEAPAVRVEQLRAAIAKLPSRASFTARMYKADTKAGWLGWLAEYNTSGFYKRKKPGVWAKAAYNHLESPWALLWLGEQLGVRHTVLVKAARATHAAPENLAQQSAAIRKVIPWETIEQHLLERHLITRSIDTPAQLRAHIKRLSPASRITNRFDAAWAKLEPSAAAKATWYKTQHEHWLGWLKGYEGPGAYARVTWDRSAEFAYNHIMCPPMLTYLAEACGVDDATVWCAAKAALKAAPKLPSMCGAVRRVIPWREVELLLVSY